MSVGKNSCNNIVKNEKVEELKNENDVKEIKVSSGYYEKAPRFGHRGPSKLGQELKMGLATFLVIAASIVFYFVFLRFTNLFAGFGIIISILKPILYGLVFAYLLQPIVKAVENLLTPFFEKYMKKEGRGKRIARLMGIALALVFVIVSVVALCNLIIPELYVSIKNLIYTVPDQLSIWIDKINVMGTNDSTLGIISKNIIEQGTTYFQTWLKTDLLKEINIIMSDLTLGILGFINELLNVIIGLIVSIYVLSSKEQFSGQCKKVVYAIMTPSHANMTLHITRKSNEMFGGFIVGKIINAIIIGVFCFIGLSILHMPYALLIGVIIGVTNIVPFFGPFIGAIPSSLLVLLADPVKGIYFIIFILILQQLDSNIIGPKILGEATGLSPFWVIFSILLGGGLFGFVGMVMGVPTFAVIYYIIEMIINQKLEKKHLPIASNEYDEMSYVDELSGDFVK